jgi:hypothetical protein
MKTSIAYIAGLTLAAALYTLPAIAQAPPGGVIAGTPAPPGRNVSRVEIESSDEDGSLALARAGAADAERTVRKLFGGDSPDRPLIIASSEPDDKALANLDEDLNIMSRVLDKSADHGDEGDRKAMGIHLWALGGGNRARNMYIEGYGAIFMLNVNMPLLAPSSKPPTDEKKGQTSSTWEEARNELYGGDNAKGEFKRFHSDKKPAPPFDAERVEDLKKDLTEALKNATHIRGIKGDEYVTLVVQGPASDGNVRRAFRANPDGRFESGDAFAYAFAGSGAGSKSAMTLRAKKSDIDAFAKGNGDLDDFRKKVTIATYKTTSGGGESGRTRF